MPLIVPIVPYHHGGGQAPLQTFVPSPSPTPSTPLVILPEDPLVAVQSIVKTEHPSFTTSAAPDLSPNSIIDILPTLDSAESQPANAYKPSHILVGGSASLGNPEAQMKSRKGPAALLGTFLGLFTFSGLYQNFLFPKITPISERQEESTWVASSNSWVDRKICNWFGFCGLAHLDKSGWTQIPQKGNHQKQQTPFAKDDGQELKFSFEDYWTSGKSNPERWSENERLLREIPQYVLEYAPYVHLYSGEEFWPCDIADHLIHTTPHLNYTALRASSDHPNLTDLNDLNRWGRFVYLQSDDNVEERPEWLGGETNIPTRPGASGNVPAQADGEGNLTNEPTGSKLESFRRLGKKVKGGRSDAPAVLITVDKGDGIVDAFWFFFYSYNLGNKVFNVRFGNHVGDWEHTAVRFVHGEPTEVWFSEHNFGSTYTYDAVEKIGKRPVVYSATGTHAMYGTAGTHPYVLPGGILHDVTDRGPLWDPLQNVHSFTYDHVNDTLRSSTLTPHAPLGWFYFIGHWGDKFYPLNDPRQYRFVGQYHYVNGPLGPRFKNLDRKHLCPDTSQCAFKTKLEHEGGHLKRYVSVGEGEEMSEQDVRRFVGPEQDEQ